MNRSPGAGGGPRASYVFIICAPRIREVGSVGEQRPENRPGRACRRRRPRAKARSQGLRPPGGGGSPGHPGAPRGARGQRRSLAQPPDGVGGALAPRRGGPRLAGVTHFRGAAGRNMAAPMEVAVCTDSGAQLWSCVVWELHSGANLLTYRGGQAGPRGLALLNGEYLLAAQLGKNYISAWELQRKDQLQQKIVCPGPVTCLTTSPNGLYVLAGVAESIYLWEVSTGNLLVILSRHYQDVSCLQFTGDSSHFLSGGKDCLVLVWGLYSVLQADPSRTPSPRHVWSRHTLPITDLHCGFGGPLARVATSSLDQTVKLWEVSSGELLLSVLFDVGIMAVTMDLAEYHLFCGGSDGSIFQVDLCTWPGQREKSFQPEPDSGKVFRGHRNQVTCLSVSTDGSVLLSGSHDETVRLWDTQSKQCIRTVTLKGPVTNATIMLAPVSMLSSDFRPGLPLPHFNRHLLGAEHGDEPHRGGFTLRLGLHQQGSEPSHQERAERLHAVMSSTMEKSVLGGQDQLRVRVAELEDEVRNLRKVNRDLFDFSTRIITRPTK